MQGSMASHGPLDSPQQIERSFSSGGAATNSPYPLGF